MTFWQFMHSQKQRRIEAHSHERVVRLQVGYLVSDVDLFHGELKVATSVKRHPSTSATDRALRQLIASVSDLSYTVSMITVLFTTFTQVITLAPPERPLPLERIAMRTL